MVGDAEVGRSAVHQWRFGILAMYYYVSTSNRQPSK